MRNLAAGVAVLVLLLVPLLARGPEKDAIILSHGGPSGANGKPWRLDMTISADGTVRGSYSNLEGTPSRRLDATIEGKLGDEELARLRRVVDRAYYGERPARGTKADLTFSLTTTLSGRTRSVSGYLGDYPHFVSIVKTLAEAAERLDGPSRLSPLSARRS